jgi:hypothetical protein
VADFGIGMLPDLMNHASIAQTVATTENRLCDEISKLVLTIEIYGLMMETKFGESSALVLVKVRMAWCAASERGQAAIARPERVRRLVLCGSVGVPFAITPGLDAVWGYEPTVENMKRLLDLLAFDGDFITEELVELRYRASIEPGFQKSYSGLFPAPRQRWVDALASDEVAIAGLPHETLILHGREDRVIPSSNSFRLFELIQRAQLHVFGRCGHWTQIEHAKHFSGLIAQFLE